VVESLRRTFPQPATRLLSFMSPLMLAGFEATALAQQLPRIRVSDNNRYLQTADGEPFFWLGDTAWWLFRLDPSEVEQYMTDRAAKGFTVIQGPVLLIELENYEGETNFDPSEPNEQWLEHIDTIIAEAEEQGLYIAPVLAWGDNESILDESSAYDWGHVIGDRYKDRTNIAAFIVAGEYNYPEANVQLWTSLAEGLEAGLDSADVMFAAFPRWFGGYSGQTTSASLHDQPWQAFNAHQSSFYGDCTNDPGSQRYIGTHNWLLAENDYALTPSKPMFDSEATYEAQGLDHPSCDFNDDAWDAFGCRRRAYWSVFAGAFGHTYGANGVFQFNQADDPIDIWSPPDYWDVAIDYPGASQMQHLRALIESRPFFTRIPGQDFVISPADDDVPTHMHATRDSSGRYAMVYIPGADRDVTVNMGLITGSTARAWWYSPVNGASSIIGEYSSSGSRTFSTPSDGDDWILLVDDLNQGYGPPGGNLGDVVAGDATGDGVVDSLDFAEVLAQWGPCNSCSADFNVDESVDSADIAILLSNWD
jgi:hypothetical protein